MSLFISVLIATAVYALVALSFGLIFSTTRFFHIAHGVVYTAGAYAAFAVVRAFRQLFDARAALVPSAPQISQPADLFSTLGSGQHAQHSVLQLASISGEMPDTQSIGLLASSVTPFPLWAMLLAGLAAIATAALLGVLMELYIFRPLRRRGATPMVLLIASLGLYIVLQNTISAFFGDSTRSIRTWPVREGLEFFDARITPAQIIIIVAAILLFLATALVLRYSRAGISMRALASSPDLAVICGMDADRITLITMAVASALAGAAAFLISLDIDMTPTMGLNALLMGVVAAIAGGVGSLRGAVLGALLLATAQQLGVLSLPSQWQDAIAFAVLLAFLLFRPSGIFASRMVSEAA